MYGDTTPTTTNIEKEIREVTSVTSLKKLMFKEIEVEGFTYAGGPTRDVPLYVAMEEEVKYFLNKRLSDKLLKEIYYDHLRIKWTKGTSISDYTKGQCYICISRYKKYSTITLYYKNVPHTSVYSKSREIEVLFKNIS